jgi:hypothetical protein
MRSVGSELKAPYLKRELVDSPPNNTLRQNSTGSQPRLNRFSPNF